MPHCRALRRLPWVLVGVLGQAVAAHAGSESDASAPGFADFRLGISENRVDGNLILRRPFLVAGASYDAIDGAPDVTGFGALARAAVGEAGTGEWVLGGNYLASADSRQWEIQAKYITPGGFGLGAGLIDAEATDELWFVNGIARGKRGALNYQFSALIQSGPGGLSPGGYAALYAEHLFISGGGDGEQWRILGAWSANSSHDSAFDPSIEFLFVDNDVGHVNGEKFLFVNGSLKRNKGFLSTGSRLGRALGPQGLQFANPVSFLSQPWSRTVDVWEIGEILNIRFARRTLPDGAVNTLAQTVVFPMQALGSEARYRGLFAGIQHQRDASRSTALLFGHAGRLGRAWVSVVGSHDVEQGGVSGVLGIRIFF